MALQCQLVIRWSLPGLLACVLILTLILSALIAIFHLSLASFNLQFLFSYELWHIFSFTITQAILSTLLSVLLALILAKAIYPLEFIGKRLLLKLYVVTFALPPLVLITALPQIYGRSGWLAKLWQLVGFEYNYSIYGLPGILMAHIFFNMPLACLLFYQTLDSIAPEQRQLSAQLGLSYWQNFRYLELPILGRQLMPLSASIFMLCFASFAIILNLGGGPKNTSFEVAIYQSLRDFEFDKVIVLTFIQLLFSFSIMFFFQHLRPNITPSSRSASKHFPIPQRKRERVIGYSVIFFAAFYILSPLIAILVNGLSSFSHKLLFNSNLLMATITSLSIAIGSSTLALLFAILLLWTSSRMQLLGYKRFSNQLLLIGSLVLAVPSMVLASGFFFLAYENEHNNTVLVITLIILTNGLMALPFIIKILENPTKDVVIKYDRLVNSLNLTGLRRFYLIEYKALKSLYLFSFALSIVVSLGDFGIIALFGNQHFYTLPFYLHQQLGAYRNEAANFTALVLLLLCISVLYLIELFRTTHHDRT